MSLINPKYPFIQTYTEPKIDYFLGHEQPSSGLAALHDFLQNNDAWYCAITTENSLSIFSIKELMTAEEYSRVCNKTAFLIIDLSFEPFLEVIDSIYENIIVRQGFPSSQVIFMSNMCDAGAYNKTAAVRYKQEPIKIFFFPALENMLHMDKDNVKPKNLEIKKEYPKKFLNLNRRWRPHRPLLTILLYHKKLLEQGFVSFGPCEESRDWDKAWHYIKVLADNNSEMLEAINQSESIKTAGWWYLDTDELDTNRAIIEPTTDKYYYDSYFSLISETTFYSKNPTRNSRFITEKTFKAILMKHPFVIVSIPQTLKFLRKIGYKTFAPYIDESYDLETDDNKRMMMIANEVERLCNLNKEQLEEFIKNVLPICNHNYQKLVNRKNFIYNDEYLCTML